MPERGGKTECRIRPSVDDLDVAVGVTVEDDPDRDQRVAVGDHAGELQAVVGHQGERGGDDLADHAVPQSDGGRVALARGVDLEGRRLGILDRRPVRDQVLVSLVEDGARDLGGGRQVDADAAGASGHASSFSL